MWRSLRDQISTIGLPEVSFYLPIVSREVVSGTDNKECGSLCCQKRGPSPRFPSYTGNKQFSYPIPPFYCLCSQINKMNTRYSFASKKLQLV